MNSFETDSAQESETDSDMPELASDSETSLPDSDPDYEPESDYESEIDENLENVIIDKLDYISEQISQLDDRLIRQELRSKKNNSMSLRNIVFYMYFIAYYFLK